MRDLYYIFIAYISGSILFANVAAKLLNKDITTNSKDKNPGTFNAFKNGGLLCGLIALFGDLFKGIIPVYLYLKGDIANDILKALVIAAPVIGHIYPIFHNLNGGKGIATSFGVFIGLLPSYKALLMLIIVFVVYTFIIKIKPDYYKTLITYFSMIILSIFTKDISLTISISLIAIAIISKLKRSSEFKDKIEVSIL